MSDAVLRMASEIREHVEYSVDAIESDIDDLFDEIERFYREFDHPRADVDPETAQMLSTTLYRIYGTLLATSIRVRRLRDLEQELHVNIMVLT
jgi:hypothetical protein